MKTLFVTVFVAVVLATSGAAEQKAATLDDIKTRMAKIELGMTRKQCDAIIGEAWVEVITAGWNSGQHAYYYSRSFPAYQIEIWYSWTGEQGIGRHSKPEDYVIRLPELKARKPTPSQ